ncbi:MAG TPA: RagB/SusD family nutrient uptake outer membrane protein [Gemmatimonadaceae bacterium]|nr:RagB/SusD family nutrient uptake outer membrane protein [Gemmatimonadaceae bacterium]
MRIRYSVLLAATLLASPVACKDFLTEQPQDFFSPSNFPSTEADLAIALGAIDDWYTGGSNQAYFIRGWPMVTEVPSDQTIYAKLNDSRYEMDTFTMSPDNEWMWRVWRQIYGAINSANVLIDKIPDMNIPQATKDMYYGAAEFHRAFNLFNAVRVWGSVPLITKPWESFADVDTVHRAPIPAVYAQIVADLTDAAAKLPVRWPGSATPDDGRPTRGAANTMLADAYMNMAGWPNVQGMSQADKWAKAAAAANAVITSGAYHLVPNFADLWIIANKNGPEHIYSIQFEGLKRNLFTDQSRPSGIGIESGINYWYTTQAFMDSYSDADARKAPTFLTQVITGGKTYRYTDPKGYGDKSSEFPTDPYHPYYGKFYDAGGPGMIKQNNSRTDLNWPIYRYAETLLIYAEAENEAVGPDASAYAAINQVRNRAKLPNLTPALSQAQFRDSVHQERSWELAFESKRLFDLKRWGTFYDVLKSDARAGIGIKPENIFMPIPQREIDLNPNLGQNPGY